MGSMMKRNRGPKTYQVTLQFANPDGSHRYQDVRVQAYSRGQAKTTAAREGNGVAMVAILMPKS